ncbi:hypothetical protein [Streptomyces sp. Je 1-332]
MRSAFLAFDEPIDGVGASDHYGVVADLEVGLLGEGPLTSERG